MASKDSEPFGRLRTVAMGFKNVSVCPDNALVSKVEKIKKGNSEGINVWTHSASPSEIPWMAVLLSRISIKNATEEPMDIARFRSFKSFTSWKYYAQK